MSWKCPVDGYTNEDAGAVCSSCGFVRMPSCVVLTSRSTGKQVRMRISTIIGRAKLQTFAGTDAEFASDPQFEVIKDEARGQWLISHNASARNPTFYNGLELGGKARSLDNDGIISIGPERLQLVVTLES